MRPWATHAALVDGAGQLVEMLVEWAFDGLRAGALVEARALGDGRALADGQEALLDGADVPAGRRFIAEVLREALPETGRLKPARLRAAAGPARPAPLLADRLAALGHRVHMGIPAEVAEAWDSGWQAAALGRLALEGGLLRFSPTPALVAVDIDGTPAADAAAAEVARAIRLWGLGGSIVVDFPTREGRAWRQQAAARFDAAMAGLAFERTAINGFGLMQVVRPRPRPSILERAMLMPAAAQAVALLDAALGEPRPGRLTLVARPAVAQLLGSRPDLLAAAARHAGRTVDVRADPSAGTGHVDAS